MNDLISICYQSINNGQSNSLSNNLTMFKITFLQQFEYNHQYRMIEHINKLFMAVIVLSLFTYFQRPDYNLPLFAFIILLWDNAYVKQKTRLWYLMAVSLLVDLIWIIYWSVTWGGYKNPEAGLCNFTVFISVLIFILKLVIIILTYVKVDDCKRAVSELSANVKYVFKGPTGYEPVE